MTDDSNSRMLRIRVTRRRRGAMLALIAVSMPVTLFVIAFAVDLAYMRMARNELRVSADAAARAAGHSLASTGDRQEARANAEHYALNNAVAGEALQLAREDVEFGTAEYNEREKSWDFEPDSEDPNAVRVTARRTSDSPSGTIKTFFGGTFGFANAELSRSAMAVVIEPQLVLVVDRSDTMAFEEDTRKLRPGWQYCDQSSGKARFTHTRVQLEKLLRALDRTETGEDVGLVTFAANGEIESYPDLDYGEIRDDLRARTKKFCGGSRNSQDGLSRGMESLESGDPASHLASKHILLLTDGGTASNLVATAEQAKQRGIKVHTVGYSEDADQTLLRETARRAGGRHWGVNKMRDFKVVIDDLLEELKPTFALVQ